MPLEDLARSPLAPTLEADHPEVPLSGAVHCPDCGKEMRRIAYCGDSKVIIDTCSGHGVWLDDGELSGIVAYVRHCVELLGDDPLEPAPKPVGILAGLARWFRGI